MNLGFRCSLLTPPYRVAYYYDPHRLERGTLEKIHQAGFAYILSCDMYLDILPKGINKGASLLGLLEFLNISHEIVITSGDSLNNLSLFQTRLKGSAVGNSEPKLVEIVKQLNNVFQSQLPALLGIIDGLRHYEKFHLF